MNVGFWIELGSLVVTVVSAGFAIWTYFKSKNRKLITYEFEDKDTNVVSIDRDKGENIQILLDGEQVEEVRYQLIKLRNEGDVAIGDNDYYNKPLQIIFVPKVSSSQGQPSQVVLRAGIPEAAQSLNISSHNAKDHITLNVKNQSVSLKDVLLNPGDWIRIKALTLGKVEIKVDGQIRDGEVKKFTTPKNILTWRNVITYLLVGALLFFVLYNSIGLIIAITQGSCELGVVAVKGSSAFYDTAHDYADSYHAACPIGFVNVDKETSTSGLSDLKNGSIQIANSEISGGAAGLDPTNFEDNQVAVIVFSVVINKQVTGITSLSSDQLAKIYDGTYRNWKDVDSRAPDMAIKVFGRPTSSGTYTTFTRYVLGLDVNDIKAHSAPSYQEEDRTDQVAQAVAKTGQEYGAIGYVDEKTAGENSSTLLSVEINQQAPTPTLIENNVYPFWAIEHMYTKKNPDRLASSFIDYVTNRIVTNGTFIKIQDMPPHILQLHS